MALAMIRVSWMHSAGMKAIPRCRAAIGLSRSRPEKPNAFGLYDMHGNVAQWCIDAYDPKSHERFAGKTVNWHDCIVWPSTRYPCILRGGTFDRKPRIAVRRSACIRRGNSTAVTPSFSKASTGMRMFTIGFRMVSPVKVPTEQEKFAIGAPRIREQADAPAAWCK